MAITFQSNQTVNGTTGDDLMVGTQTAGNFNDIVYGHQGDDTITSTNGLFNSNLYGGQGNDLIFDSNFSNTVSGNAIYGNLGNDTIISDTAQSESLFGGQGDDFLVSDFTRFNLVYGNIGNDTISTFDDFSSTLYGGQGNDSVFADFVSNDLIYGNMGNDLLMGEGGVSDSHMWGGQGDDILSFTGRFGGSTFNDVETGNLGNDVFAADNGQAGGGTLTNVNDIVTVTDFLQGSDKLTETEIGGLPLVKISAAGANAQQALDAANTFYTAASPREYVFVYGGTAAGYLFYNGNGGGNNIHSGMAIDGATGEGSVNATDIIARPANA